MGRHAGRLLVTSASTNLLDGDCVPSQPALCVSPTWCCLDSLTKTMPACLQHVGSPRRSPPSSDPHTTCYSSTSRSWRVGTTNGAFYFVDRRKFRGQTIELKSEKKEMKGGPPLLVATRARSHDMLTWGLTDAMPKARWAHCSVILAAYLHLLRRTNYV